MLTFFKKAAEKAAEYAEYLLMPELPKSTNEADVNSNTTLPSTLKRSIKGVSNLTFLANRSPHGVENLANLNPDLNLAKLPTKQIPSRKR